MLCRNIRDDSLAQSKLILESFSLELQQLFLDGCIIVFPHLLSVELERLREIDLVVMMSHGSVSDNEFVPSSTYNQVDWS